jgi:hypothetical protein
MSGGGDRSVDLAPNPVIEAYKRDVDVTLLDENLKLSVPDRLRKLREFVDALEEIRSSSRPRCSECGALLSVSRS